jgi:hypothetical protein
MTENGNFVSNFGPILYAEHNMYRAASWITSSIFSLVAFSKRVRLATNVSDASFFS